jgi:hypothetical protein
MSLAPKIGGKAPGGNFPEVFGHYLPNVEK